MSQSAILKIIRSNKKIILIQFVLYITQMFLSIILVDAIALMSDYLAENNYASFLARLPITISIIVIEAIVYFGMKNVIAYYKANIRYMLKKQIYFKYTHTTYSKAKSITIEELLTIYHNKIDLICNYVVNTIDYFINPLTVIVATIYFWKISVKLLVIAIIIIPISSVLFNKLSRPTQAKSKKILEHKTSLSGIMKDVIQGFYIMKAYRLQQFFSDKFSDITRNLSKEEKEKDKFSSILGRIFIILRYMPQLAIPLYGGYLAYIGQITVGQLITANSMIWYIIGPVEGLLSLIKERRGVIPAMDSITSIFDLEEELNEIPINQNENHTTILRLHNLSFSYLEENIILKNINFELNKNQHIAMIGESGSGKSTMIKILSGFLPGYKGDLIIQGIMITPELISYLRKKVSYISQHPYCFSGTIYENIVMGKLIPLDQVIQIAKLMQAYEFIMQFPDGFNTVIGSGGIQLSGGQMKRIGLMRVLLEDRSIVLLDEPTSGIDQTTAYKVIKEVRNVCKEKTLIMITHDTNVCGDFDNVYKLDKGVLYEA